MVMRDGCQLVQVRGVAAQIIVEEIWPKLGALHEVDPSQVASAFGPRPEGGLEQAERDEYTAVAPYFHQTAW